MGRFCTLACLSYYTYLFLTPQLSLSADPCCTLPSLADVSIDELNYLQSVGVVSSVDLVSAYTHRTNEVNNQVHAVAEINPDALEIAKARDVERANGFVRSPLHGIPILLKDNIATTDSLNTSAGSYALLGAEPQYEASVAQKLREAGAVIIGKATMGEWAQYRSKIGSSSAGWSALHGQTLGAYHPQQDPHGSSSGSAVAVSIGLASSSLATETSGSIVNPAERNNLVGIKPTLGLTSRDMVIPITLRQDSVGPIAQTVKDAAYILTAIAGKDRHDSSTSSQPFNDVPEYSKVCRFDAFEGARLGVPRNGIEPFLDKSTTSIVVAFEHALELIASAGASIQDNANFSAFDRQTVNHNMDIVMDTDFPFGLAKYLSKLKTNPNNLQSFQDLVRFTKAHPLEGLPERDIYEWERSMERGLVSNSTESKAAYESNLAMAEDMGVLEVLDKYNLDAIIMPTFTSFYLPSIAGLPIVTVPLGFYPMETPIKMNPKGDMVTAGPGIPFGLAFVGRRWSEETLISLAYAFEQRTLVRKQQAPLIKPTFELSSQLQDFPAPVAPSPSNIALEKQGIGFARHPSITSKFMASLGSFSLAWVFLRTGLSRIPL